MLFDFDFAEDCLGFVLSTPPAGTAFDAEDERLGIAGSVEVAFSMAFVDDRLLFDLRLRIPTADEDAMFTSSFSLFAAAATMLDDFDAL